tara:strand:+ start:290 stop:505 length:216 start_codon:yes stop_codon:yes gene_type:complete
MSTRPPSLIFTGNVPADVNNSYTPGSGVGAVNASVRRALKRKASSTNNTDNNRPCCPEIQSNPADLAHPKE